MRDIRGVLRGREQGAMKCARVCDDMVISWGDQQLVTSIVLLIAALKKLHVDKDISTYHSD